LRGIRTAADFEFERNIGLMNLEMAPEIESVFLLSRPEFSALSSTVVRDIKRHGGDISKFIPEALR
jgi:pantetheine-phosphate adenylyltransferase